jgi:hypothetical protein
MRHSGVPKEDSSSLHYALIVPSTTRTAERSFSIRFRIFAPRTHVESPAGQISKDEASRRCQTDLMAPVDRRSCTSLHKTSETSHFTRYQPLVVANWRLLTGSDPAKQPSYSLRQSSGLEACAQPPTSVPQAHDSTPWPGEMPHTLYPERSSFSRNANIARTTDIPVHYRITAKLQASNIICSPQDRSPKPNSHVTLLMTHPSAFVTLYPRPHYPIPLCLRSYTQHYYLIPQS